MRHLLWLLLAVVPLAFAQGPYDATITFDPPTSDEPVDGYRLYLDAELVQSIVSGETVPGLFPTEGSYEVGVAAFNEAGEGPMATSTVTIDAIELPGEPTNLDIQVDCSPCVLSVTSP